MPKSKEPRRSKIKLINVKTKNVGAVIGDKRGNLDIEAEGIEMERTGAFLHTGEGAPPKPPSDAKLEERDERWHKAHPILAGILVTVVGGLVLAAVLYLVSLISQPTSV